MTRFEDHNSDRPQPSPLRLALALAAEARRRGDHGAADVHEADALLELRRQLAAAGQRCAA